MNERTFNPIDFVSECSRKFIMQAVADPIRLRVLTAEEVAFLEGMYGCELDGLQPDHPATDEDRAHLARLPDLVLPVDPDGRPSKEITS